MPTNTRRPYGLDDHISCERCSAQMSLYRRGPHPRRTGHEIQRYECGECKAQFVRTIDIAGNVSSASRGSNGSPT